HPAKIRQRADFGIQYRLFDEVAAYRGTFLLAGLLAHTQLRTPILGSLLPALLVNQAFANRTVLRGVDDVLCLRWQNAFNLLLGLLDPRGIHRVARKDTRHRPRL